MILQSVTFLDELLQYYDGIKLFENDEVIEFQLVMVGYSSWIHSFFMISSHQIDQNLDLDFIVIVILHWIIIFMIFDLMNALQVYDEY